MLTKDEAQSLCIEMWTIIVDNVTDPAWRKAVNEFMNVSGVQVDVCDIKDYIVHLMDKGYPSTECWLCQYKEDLIEKDDDNYACSDSCPLSPDIWTNCETKGQPYYSFDNYLLNSDYKGAQGAARRLIRMVENWEVDL
jgi:hypothetical protein